MSTEGSAAVRRLSFRKLLLISFALHTGSLAIEQAVRWSDLIEGLLVGLILVFVAGVDWCIVIVPWSIAVWGIYHWRHWHSFRTHWVLLPAVAQTLFIIGWLCVYPPTAHGNFRRFAKAEIPADANGLQYHLWGGGTADYSISYYFESSQESLAKLITDMQMGEGFEFTSEHVPQMQHIGRLKSPPDLSQWIGGKSYSRETGAWIFHLVTDPTQTKAYVWLWCI